MYDDYRLLENGTWVEQEWYGLPKTPKFYKLEYPLT